MIDQPYVAEAARGLRWDDPALNIVWPAPVAVIAERDLAFSGLDRRGSGRMSSGMRWRQPLARSASSALTRSQSLFDLGRGWRVDLVRISRCGPR